MASTEEPTALIGGGRAQDERLAELLLRWKQLYEAGTDTPPEELCGDEPSMMRALAVRISTLKRLRWMRPPTDDRSVERSEPAGRWRERKPEMLAGRYRLERFIGEGGGGQVWQGFDLELGRPVAVKVPLTGRPSALENHLRPSCEARRAAQLRHPGIVAVHDVGAHRGGCFIVTGLVNGTDLRRHLLCGALPVQAAIRIAAEVAEALHYAHQREIIHRDVKPANILIDQGGHALITDFGIAVT